LEPTERHNGAFHERIMWPVARFKDLPWVCVPWEDKLLHQLISQKLAGYLSRICGRSFLSDATRILDRISSYYWSFTSVLLTLTTLTPV